MLRADVLFPSSNTSILLILRCLFENMDFYFLHFINCFPAFLNREPPGNKMQMFLITEALMLCQVSDLVAVPLDG